MTISFGSGQTNGAPLLITAITLGTAQTVHTAPAGSATPNLVDLFASNTSSVGVQITVSLYDSVAALIRSFTLTVGALALQQPLFDNGSVEANLILNGTIAVKVHAETASVISISAAVDNQSSTTGTVAQNLASGLVAAVQNANRFALPAPGGGVGTATEVNANIMIGRAGTIRNLKAKADTTVGGGATVTCALRVNGVTSALGVTIAAAQTTVLQVDTDTVAVAAGDLVTFMVSCDNAGAPAANFQIAAEYIAA
jgi:hypothetical protein